VVCFFFFRIGTNQMAKYEYMLQRAMREVWCNPLMDNQHVFAPARISQGYGALNRFFALDRFIPTPKPDIHYHIFQIGQLTPAQLNLLERNPSWTAEKWFTFTEAMNKLKLYVNIYNAEGVNIPRFTSYFMFTREKCLMFAVERDARIRMNSDEGQIYFRVYTNAYFSSRLGVSRGATIETKGYTLSNMQDLLNAQMDYRRALAKPGYAEAFVNGFLVNDINPGTARTGDRVEWIQDGSVKRIVTWRVGDLTPFTSTMDKKFKHLLHYESPDPHQIDYQDDLDVALHTPNIDTRGYRGRYYPKNMPSAMRNVTHRDYSVMGATVKYVCDGIIRDMGKDAPGSYQDMKLMLKIREGGYQRPLIKDNARIFELYKLKDADILAAMSGIISAPPVWHAADLEANDYPKVMRTLLEKMTILDVEGCYGYNSMSQILADTPQKTYNIGNFNVVNPPELLQRDSTFYEFDEQGALLGWHYHVNDDDYSTRSPVAKMVEGIVGRGTERTSVTFGQSGIKVPADAQYRVYYRRVLVGQPQDKWTDVTGDARYRIINNTLEWTDPNRNYELMVRTNQTFLAYDTKIKMVQGMLRFTLSETLNKGSGFQPYAMEVPMGQLQIWMNSRNLVRGVDYILDFPNVYINSYPFLNQPAATAEQLIHVRFTGFCTPAMQLDDEQQFGFVEHGALSNNRRYDLCDDKVLHISVGGNTMDRSDLKFFEDRPGYDIQNPLNGRPYQITAIVPPLRDYTKTAWPELRKKSLAIDKVVSDYMTEYMPPLGPWKNSSSISRWPLFSPFFSHILYRLSTGGFFLVTDAEWTDEEVITMCKPYESLFATDPLEETIALPDKFVVIRPHPYNNTVNLTKTQYRFLMQVVKLYGRGKIGINNFVTFTA